MFIKGENIDKIVAYFTSLGKTYIKMLEEMIKDAKEHYTEDEYSTILTNNNKIDPVLEIQGWLMEVSSTELVPQYNTEPKSYSSFIFSSLVKPGLATPSKSRTS